MKPEILFEDNHLVVVNKRAGYLATADKSEKKSEEQEVRLYLAETKQVPIEKVFLKPLHQIDLPVSGCLVFAKSSKAAARISELFQKKKVKKEYLFLSAKNLRLTEEKWIDDILWDEKLRRAVIVKDHPDAKKSELIISSMDSGRSKYFLYQVNLITGRKHQIRIQTSSRGLFIVGDTLYGGHSDNNLNSESIALHCHKMNFPHPISGVVAAEAKLPIYFRKL